MPRRAITFLAFLAIVGAPFVIAAFAAVDKVEHDDPMRPLDSRYHDLPESLVERLRLSPPPRPYAFLNTWCFRYERVWPWQKPVEYCVCYNEEGCRELKSKNECSAKLGALAPGLGVCRKYLERVVVTG